MSILRLPTEVILEVASYLDWARTDLCPTKTDVVSISVTCSQLREALVRVVFRDVTLRLRWQGGILIEPSLYKLRLSCPRLANHIRSICIRTDFDDDHLPHTEHQELTPFVAPVDRPNWLDLASSTCLSDGEYRGRANDAAWRLAEPHEQQYSEASAETLIGLASAQRQPNKARLDALKFGIFMNA